MEIEMIEGFKFAAVSAGIKKADSDRLDFGLIVADVAAAAAAVTTTNIVCAAPVEITRERLAAGRCRAVLINSGNANAFSGTRGRSGALELTAAVAEALGDDPGLVAPMSTGVIGTPLPTERMRSKIPELVGRLHPESSMDVARAMMTTDTRPKTSRKEGLFSGGKFSMLGMAKGAGMIAPHMATMLSVILTDVKVDPVLLKQALAECASGTFNRVTIDSDTSTNDTLLIMAGGHPGARELGSDVQDRTAFKDALGEVCMDLARQIVLDAEGGTKAVEVRVFGAPNGEAADRVARTIADSPLVKTAFHGQDPNWGRIVAAAGRSGVAFDPNRIDLFIGEVPIVRGGELVAGDWESAAHEVMKKQEFSILLDLKAGEAEATILTADLSEEYVGINADYRS
jgi:glutamate N-acetyltransferase / amino-acid N-acetyltransferase